VSSDVQVRLPVLQVDAFACRPLQGNPCAVVLDADDLDTPTMQAIAREMNLSETAFVIRSEVADFRARYFTPAEEIPLAGHPTLATTRALIDTGRLAVDADGTRFHLELRDGPIAVDVRGSGDLAEITMTQRQPVFLRSYAAAEILPLFGLDETDGHAAAPPPQTVSTGTPMLMVPLRDRQALLRARLDVAAFASALDGGDFFSPHLFCLGGFTEAGATAARHFGLPPDTYEDPFTGSATGAMAAYCWHYGLIGEPVFIAEQGHCMGRPGTARVEMVGAAESIDAVRVGGHAVTVLTGVLTLPPG
jgi:trans-2,3-dihydro-3-hydroxyanthranilate isomerase